MVFQEALIERAVKASLGLEQGWTLHPLDLERVTGIYIAGNNVYASAEEAVSEMQRIYASGGDVNIGLITQVEDLAMLPNLQDCYIMFGNITDIGPMAELEYLVNLDFRHSPIADISPLEGKDSLQRVSFSSSSQVSDISAVASWVNLTSLDLCASGPFDGAPIAQVSPTVWEMDLSGAEDGYYYLGERELAVLRINCCPGLDSMDYLAGLTGLEHLDISQTGIPSLEGIQQHQQLQSLHIYDIPAQDMSPLLTLPNLQSITVDQAQAETIAQLGGLGDVEVIVV